MTLAEKLTLASAGQEVLTVNNRRVLSSRIVSLVSDKLADKSEAIASTDLVALNQPGSDAYDAYFTLGHFAVEESLRSFCNAGHPQGMPMRNGIARRFEKYLSNNAGLPGTSLLERVYKYGTAYLGMSADAWVYELAVAAMDESADAEGCDRFVEDYIEKALSADACAKVMDAGAFEATVDALVEAGVLKSGDRVAVGISLFDYLPESIEEKHGLEIVYINGVTRSGVMSFPKDELDELKDGSIKAFFIVDTPAGGKTMLSEGSRSSLAEVIAENGLKVACDQIVLSGNKVTDALIAADNILGKEYKGKKISIGMRNARKENSRHKKAIG